MSKLLLTAQAKRDLAYIKAYIITQWNNPAAALRVVGSITKALRGLEQFPNLGQTVQSDLNRLGYRVLVCGAYLSFYRVQQGDVQVDPAFSMDAGITWTPWRASRRPCGNWASPPRWW